MDQLSEADLQCLVQGRLGSGQVVTRHSQPLLSSGLDIFANWYVLGLTVNTSSGQVSKLSFIGKTPPQNEAQADFIKSIRAFHKETSLYNNIFKDLNNEIIAKVSPECFLAQPEKCIILDNLFDLGYKKVDVKQEFNVHHCELVLDVLAKLHASSLILEETKSKLIPDLYPDCLFETIYSDDTDHAGFSYMCTGINALEALFNIHFSHFPKSVIRDTMTSIRNLPFKLKPSVNYRNVLNQGGVWGESALFSSGIDGLPSDIRLIDFSNARYAPPACDVLIFLHLTTSRAFRELHQGALLTHYYSRLAKEVQAKGLDLGKLLPWTEFEASCQYYVGVAIVAALLHTQVSLLPEDTLASVTKDQNTLKTFLFEDRSEKILSAYSYNEMYRRRLGQALVQALEFTQFRGRRRSSVYISA